MIKKLMLIMLISCFVLSISCGKKMEVPPATHPDVSGWDNVFTADLSNAAYSDTVWSVTDDVLSANHDQCIWTTKQYDNFILDLEFKTDHATNSGVIVYCTDTENWIPNSVEIQIADDHSEEWGKADAKWQCGAIFGHLAATKSLVKKPGEWNRYTITCIDKKIYVILNGEQVNEMDMSLWTSATVNPDSSEIPPWLSTPFAELATKGYIGFQGKHGESMIYFRNLKIKELD